MPECVSHMRHHILLCGAQLETQYCSEAAQAVVICHLMLLVSLEAATISNFLQYVCVRGDLEWLLEARQGQSLDWDERMAESQ